MGQVDPGNEARTHRKWYWSHLFENFQVRELEMKSFSSAEAVYRKETGKGGPADHAFALNDWRSATDVCRQDIQFV